MKEDAGEAKRGRGRPRKYTMPPRIDASPDEIATAILRAKPPKKWRYLEEPNNEKEMRSG